MSNKTQLMIKRRKIKIFSKMKDDDIIVLIVK